MSTTRKLTPALLAAAALAITFAGSATATSLVSGKQIKNASVLGADLRDGSVDRADLQSERLGAAEIAAGNRGPRGPVGKPGVIGDMGPLGPAGVTDLRYLASTPRTLGPGQFFEATVSCAGRHLAVHGGLSASPTASALVVQESAPSNNHTTWVTRVGNPGTESVSIQGWVVCANAG